MADIADVETALVTLITTVIYPDGSTGPSAIGADCRIHRGWPLAVALDIDLKSDRVNITVMPDTAPGQTLTRYHSEWHGIPTLPTLAVTTTGQTVTFGGTARLGQITGILVDRRPYAYRTVTGDTLSSVAANLAAMIRADRIVHLAGPSLTVPASSSLVPRVVSDSPAFKEIRRQSRDLRVSIWSPSPDLRDLTVALVDAALAARAFIQLADTSFARVLYKNTTVFDQSQSASLYRRDLIYTTEYATLIRADLPSMLFGDMALDRIHVAV